MAASVVCVLLFWPTSSVRDEFFLSKWKLFQLFSAFNKSYNIINELKMYWYDTSYRTAIIKHWISTFFLSCVAVLTSRWRKEHKKKWLKILKPQKKVNYSSHLDPQSLWEDVDGSLRPPLKKYPSLRHLSPEDPPVFWVRIHRDE